MEKHLITLIATWFYSGKFPFMPGTMGTLAALPVAYMLQFYVGMEALIAATVVASIGGIWVSDRYLAVTGKDRAADPKEVVIDEVAGMWLTLCLMPLNYMEDAAGWVLVTYGGGFLAFRLLDIWKPWPISLLDRKVKGGLGIMLDDLAAAVFAVIALGVIGHGIEGLVYFMVENAVPDGSDGMDLNSHDAK